MYEATQRGMNGVGIDDHGRCFGNLGLATFLTVTFYSPSLFALILWPWNHGVRYDELARWRKGGVAVSQDLVTFCVTPIVQNMLREE